MATAIELAQQTKDAKRNNDLRSVYFRYGHLRFFRHHPQTESDRENHLYGRDEYWGKR